MQVIGWAAILMGLIHLGTVSSMLLIMIGIVVVYVERVGNKEEKKSTLAIFRERIKRIRRMGRNKKAPGVAPQQGEGDFLINALPSSSERKSKEGEKRKPDWFF